MTRVLITGGAGFTGVNLAHWHLQRGDEVVVFDNLSRVGTIENLAWLRASNLDPARLTVIVGDVRFPPAALEAEVERADRLFHLAAQVAVGASIRDPHVDFDVNALGTLNLLELVRRSKGSKPIFFYPSTNKVYGGLEDIPVVANGRRCSYGDLALGVPESQALDLDSPYGCSKGTAEQYVRAYSRLYALRSVVFRQSCIYGERQFGTEEQGWVAWFVIAALLGRKLTIYGDGRQLRDVLWVGDLIDAYDAAARHLEITSGGVYNVGGGPENTLSLLELVDHLQEGAGKPLRVGFADRRPGDQPVYVSDIRRAQRDFGWSPTTSWREGLDRLTTWVLENRAMLAAYV